MQTANQIIRHVQSLLTQLHLTEKRLLLAVSGGADSMALAYIVSRAAGPSNCHAVTVDHGFRPESIDEARDVGRYMIELGISHEIRKLDWRSDGACDYKGTAIPLPSIQKMEEMARERRYLELGTACRAQGIHAVLTGHHANDQAETFLLRFLRQSGIYGMSGMSVQAALPFAWADQSQSSQSWPKPVLVRPLLQIDKQTIYDLCKSRGIQWHEDSSNTDTRFRRNKLRQLVESRSNDEKSPFSRLNLLEVCGKMQRHRAYINEKVTNLLSVHARLDLSTGTAVLSAQAGGGSPIDTPLPIWARNTALCERVLASIVGWVGGMSHPPELSQLKQFMDAIVGHYRCSLSGQGSRSILKTVSAAGVSLYPPTAKRGWLFCRQKPRASEIKECRANSVGKSVVWDERLVVSVRPNGGAAGAAANARWSVHALADCTAQSWYREIDGHRRRIRKARKHLEPSAVQATQPVVCMEMPCKYGTGSATQTQPIFALGHAIASTLGVDCLRVDVRTLRETASPGTAEIVDVP
ncbi:hypothetical protein IW140_003030 [Coemansia sp. RSA 1813]|nr:hypothetical protein LPJ74_002479 [Coemansia sp. RSA 1843]KAJ2088982.1 hypothetical protein IW138_003823 [Coemansia sp. RSA 986]KAJ2213210.1 hypothetical protein EV179_003997 [Coemansia sp. RSA 487]KAJ2569476.1 hypothetical protein IW140_003030 [Coemansia sp. RSA 1813]